MRDISERKRQEAALQRKTDELEEANRRLRRHQEQLIQQEKMASLGQLAAGVAHEIKNPVAYVSSHMENLEEDCSDLTPLLLELARAEDEPEAYPDPGAGLKAVRPTRQQVLARMLELDLETLVESIKIALEDSRDGIERIQEIADSLRKFSRPTDDEPTELARLEDVIEDALRITHSQLKSRCELFRHYGNLRPIPCRPRQLTQVITNLLVNAAQAIPRWGKVTVSTSYEGDDAVIRISDTGAGIKPEHLKELFTPFFTTKPGSVGTGLGLSISYGIVKDHGGTITVHSVHGEGTTFEIRLPLSAAMEVKLPAEG
jgi:signal transduction histidine kinase